MGQLRSFYARCLRPVLMAMVAVLATLCFTTKSQALPKPPLFGPNAATEKDKGPSFPRPGFQAPSKKDSRKSLHSDTGLKRGIGSREAAKIAKEYIGGKVLKVRPSGDGHRVKILLPSGKVTYINVNADGKIQ